LSGDGDDFTITVARRKYPIFQIYIYLQRILHHADRGISAMLLQISRPLKPWDMQNIYAIFS